MQILGRIVWSRFVRHAGLPLILFGVLAGCATPTRVAVTEPANLYPHKVELRAYVDSGRYQAGLEQVAARALAWVEERATRRLPTERLAVVFDLDETLLLNWPSISENDFGYIPPLWEQWVDRAAAPAIESVREVYRAARKREIAVFYITGRSERDRAGTERNLRSIDCADHVELICKPSEVKQTSAAFKTAARERLTREGYTIIANLGDQESDLVGGFSERTFKLPNPFYQTF